MFVDLLIFSVLNSINLLHSIKLQYFSVLNSIDLPRSIKLQYFSVLIFINLIGYKENYTIYYICFLLKAKDL